MSLSRYLEMVCSCFVRFAVANVSDEVVKRVPERLQMLNDLAGELGWTVKED